MNEASTLTITPKRSSSRDVGTSSYRYHTATYPPASVSANERYHICGEHTALRSNGLFASMFDGLVAFAMDRWRHDCGARRVRIISRPGSPMSEGRFDLNTFRSERMNEASTLTITPKRSSSRDVGTSSYRYHTATSSPLNRAAL
ncbi:uncharacterized protein TNCV_2295231 [Trichonephila clavipes]|nr:uncharacterized protein TNCV_2295231 [Trichonephila clavipes]